MNKKATLARPTMIVDADLYSKAKHYLDGAFALMPASLLPEGDVSHSDCIKLFKDLPDPVIVASTQGKRFDKRICAYASMGAFPGTILAIDVRDADDLVNVFTQNIDGSGERLRVIKKSHREEPELPKTAKDSREPVLLNMGDVQAVEVPWLWPGRIPMGRLTLVSGRPGGGKSFLTVDLAAKISTGAEWPDGGFAPMGSTLMIAAEDDPADTIRPRLDGAGADCSMIQLLRAEKIIKDSQESLVSFDLANISLIRSALDRMPDCKLVIIDPIGSYLGGLDAHRDNEVRTVLNPLVELASEKGVAVLLVAHTRKAIALHADDGVLGARAFTGLARSVLHVDRDPEDRHRKLLLPGKCNLQNRLPGWHTALKAHHQGSNGIPIP